MRISSPPATVWPAARLALRPRPSRRCENMVGVNMVLAEFIRLKHGLYKSCGIVFWGCCARTMSTPTMFSRRRTFTAMFNSLNNCCVTFQICLFVLCIYIQSGSGNHWKYWNWLCFALTRFAIVVRPQGRAEARGAEHSHVAASARCPIRHT